MGLDLRSILKRSLTPDPVLLHVQLLRLGFSIGRDEIDERQIGSTTRSAVLELQKRLGLTATGIVDPATEASLASEIGSLQAAGRGFVVYGRLVGAEGVLTVRASDRDLRSEELLGEVTTREGHYQIRYEASQFRRAEKRRADLVVRVMNADGRQLAESPIAFNAQPVEVIDLSMRHGEEPRSEYELLVKELRPLLQGLSLAELTESQEHRDVSFLAGETGRDPLRLAWLIAGHKLERRTRIAADVFYALFSQGMPTRLSSLLVQSPGVLHSTLVRAAVTNVVSADVGDRAGEHVRALRALVAPLALEARPGVPNEAASALAEVLSSEAARAGFLDAYAQHAGDLRSFWQTLRARPEYNAHVTALQIQFQLLTMTGNHLPLVSELQRLRRSGELADLSDLTRFDEEGWLEMIGSGSSPIGAPATVPGATEAERRRFYARHLASVVERSFPTRYVVRRLETDTALPSHAGILHFLQANPSFDIRATRLKAFLAERPGALDGAADAPQVARHLRALQRVYKVAPRYKEASAMVKAGITSAFAISRMSWTTFRNEFGTVFDDLHEMKNVYHRSRQQSDTAFALAVDHNAGSKLSLDAIPERAPSGIDGVPDWPTLFGSLELCACDHCRSMLSPAAYFVDTLHFLSARPSRIKGKNVKDVLFARRPDLGEIELTCENTNTTLPYVDLVNEILEEAVAPLPTFTPFELPLVLLGELEAGKLSDDLVSAFSPSLAPDAVISALETGPEDPSWTIDDRACTYNIRLEAGKLHVLSRSRQTKGSAAERLATPQYRNELAYEELRSAPYPWSLPFDLSAVEARTYFEHLQVPRTEAMEALLPGERRNVLENADLAQDVLNITSAEAPFILGTAFDLEPWILWGFPAATLGAGKTIPDPADRTKQLHSGNWLDVLSGRVDVFLQQSGLSYLDLLDLLEPHLINPLIDGKRVITIVSTDAEHPDTCDLAKLALKGFTASSAATLVRFVRLSRCLGWTPRDLDRAVSAFAGQSLDSAFWLRLAHVKRLHDLLGLPIVRLLSWWSPIDTDTYLDHHASDQRRAPSLFDELFRNRAVVNPLDSVFAADPLSLNVSLADHQTTIATGLRLAPDQLALLSSELIAGDTLNLDNLSLLHRHASLCKALKLRVPEYVLALRLSGASPFLTTTDTLLFVEGVAAVRESGLSFQELAYLLRHDDTPQRPLVPDDTAVGVLFGTLRSQLQRIAAENTFRGEEDPAGPTVDPNGELTQQKLALLNWDRNRIDGAIATLNGVIVYEAKLPALPQDFTIPNPPAEFSVQLAALPPDFEIPVALAAVVWHDPAGNRLVASRTLTVAERTILLQASADDGNNVLLSAVQSLLAQQDALAPGATFDAARGVLRFTGPMTNARRAGLEGVQGATPDYQAAVAVLYDAPRRFVRRHLRAYSTLDLSVELETMPVAVPAGFKDRLYHDAGASPKRLHVLGPLTEHVRDALVELATDPNDPAQGAYVAAIHDLYALAETTPLEESDRFLMADSDAAALFDAALEPAARFAYVLERLLPRVRLVQSERVAVQLIADDLELEHRTADALLRTWLRSPADPARPCLDELIAASFAESNANVLPTPTNSPAQFKSHLRAHKVALLTLRMALTHEQLRWLFAFDATADWLDPGSLPLASSDAPVSFESWQRVAELVGVSSKMPRAEATIGGLLEVSASVTAASPAAARNEAKSVWCTLLAERTGCNVDDLAEFVGPADDHSVGGRLGGTFPEGFGGLQLASRLLHAFGLLRRLGVAANSAVDLVSAPLTAEDARGLRQAIRARFEDESQWLTLAQRLTDPLREAQRAALVAYLVAHLRPAVSLTSSSSQALRDADDLYAHTLMDVQMAPCMLTSRIKQALSSVQLFVQRCMMSLEPDVVAGIDVDDHWLEWKWRKNYRVWEANRKVLFYPENWIEPELRDDKSPFFVELEGELLQGELNRETAEQAFRNYLSKLDEVARLEVVGMMRQMEEDDSGNETVDVLHVFGRTSSGTPRKYFYRRFDGGFENGTWTAWERVELDITGEHVIPVVWNRRLLLFWPVFTKKAKPVELAPEDSLTATPPEEYWELQIAWSEYRNGAWSGKRTSASFIEVEAGRRAQLFGPREMAPEAVTTPRVLIREDNALLLVMLRERHNPDQVRAFRLVDSHSEPEVMSIPLGEVQHLHVGMENTVFRRMFLQQDDFAGSSALFLPSPKETLALANTSKSPALFRLLVHANGAGFRKNGTFFRDGPRTWFVSPAYVPNVRVQPDLSDLEEADPNIVLEKPPWTEILDPGGPVINPDPGMFMPSHAVNAAVEG
jgi:hypothetical protein